MKPLVIHYNDSIHAWHVSLEGIIDTIDDFGLIANLSETNH